MWYVAEGMQQPGSGSCSVSGKLAGLLAVNFHEIPFEQKELWGFYKGLVPPTALYALYIDRVHALYLGPELRSRLTPHLVVLLWRLNLVRLHSIYIKYYTPKGGYNLTLYWVP